MMGWWKESDQVNPLQELKALAYNMEHPNEGYPINVVENETSFDPILGTADPEEHSLDQTNGSTKHVNATLYISICPSVCQALLPLVKQFLKHLEDNQSKYDAKFLKNISSSTRLLAQGINAYVVNKADLNTSNEALIEIKAQAQEDLDEFRRVCEGSQWKSYAGWMIAMSIVAAATAFIFSLPFYPALAVGAVVSGSAKLIINSLKKSQSMQGEGIAISNTLAKKAENCLVDSSKAPKLKMNPICHDMSMAHADLCKEGELPELTTEDNGCFTGITGCFRR